MIPILYEKTETAFRSNGLGRLNCMRCIATEERNGIFEVEFDVAVNDPMFSEIQEGRIIACTHDEQGDVQPFDIYGRSEPINGVVTFYAHHISYRLNEITVAPFNATSCAEALMKIKAYSVNNNPFTFLTDKSVTADFDHKAPKNAKGMLVGSQGSILDIYGTGEYKYNKFEVDLYLHRGQDTNVSIRYGKNLIDYRNDFDVSNSYTAVVPYWLGEVTEGEESVSNLVMLPELFISSGHQVPSGREVVIPMDLSSDFQEPPTVEELRALATGRLRASEGWLPNQTVTVNFVQLWQTEEYKDYAPLQRLSLCDTCGVFVPMYGTSLRAKVIRVVYNVLLDRYDEMELGDKPSTFASVLEKTYNSKVTGVVAGLQAIAVDINTVQNIAAADATAKAEAAKQYADGKLASAVLDINADIADLQSQIDGNITSWFFNTDPSMNTPPVAYDPDVSGSGWDTDEKKNEHLGDIYYNTATGTAWRFIFENGQFQWLIISDTGVQEALRIASEAKDTADAKRRIFYSEPVPPYDDGDLWTQGADGDILRCAVPKAAGETYSRSDWILASKYTDNSALNAFISGTFADTVDEIAGQLDRKAETWYQSTDPSDDWITPALRQDHVGDLWYYTGDTTATLSKNSTYRWNGTSWQVQTIPSSVFDMIDGKSQIFVGATTPTGAENGDLWFQGPDKPILTYINGVWVDYNYYIDSSVSQSQADQAEAAAKDYADAALADMKDELETQIDAKIETWAQVSDPQTAWSDKAAHDKDLWLYTGLTEITVNGQAIKPQGVYQYSFIAGGALCNENRVDITDENNNVLEAADSGHWSPYASTADNLFDLADGKSTIYYGRPTGTYSGVAEGDYLVDSTNGATYRYRGGAWVKQTDYQAYTGAEISALESSLKTQIDAKIETWAQTTNPASAWTTADARAQHNGDLWLYTGTSNITVGSVTIKPQGVYKYNGSNNTWSAYSSTSNNLFDLVDGKSTIYYGTTSGTYANKEVGDYLVDSTTGATYRWSGSAWVKQTDYKAYTDSEILALRTGLEGQIDAKIETWAQSSNPATSWTTAEIRAEHNGDLWLYTGTSSITVGSVTIKPQGVYQYNGSTGIWAAYSSTTNNLFDLVDGKTTIFYGSPTGTYSNKQTGDYLVDSSTGITYRWSGSAWVKQTDYKTYTDSAISTAKQTIEQQYEQAIDDATEKIRGGTGGYVVTTVNANGQPIELLITDNLNLNRARNVWRWNQGGLAHSSNGYNGPFNDVAITADGKINASMILTGALTANLIRAGIITDVSGKNTWNLDSGQFTTKQGAIADYQINQNSLLCETVDERGTVSHAELTGSRFEIYQKTDNPPITRPAFSGIRLENNTIGIRYKANSNSSISGTSINPLFGIAFYMGEGDTTDVWSNNLPAIGTIKGTVAGLNLSPLNGADAVNVFGDLVVSGRKPRMVKTDNYQDRLLFCYETPTPLFGDIGEAVLDEEGLCYVDLDDIFSETIAAQVEYQVFLQKEGEGDCWITEKQPRFFVIQGTPGLKVAWELKAKQKGYETQRLEQYGVRLDEYRGVAEQDSLLDDFIAEQEVILYENN